MNGLGLRAEMVTNGTRLDEAMLAGLVKSGLDTLWVSFDGASEACFEGIREGADYGRVVSSLRRLREMNAEARGRIEVGIAFVVMKRNIDDLRRIDRLIEAVGASRVSVSNVLPYSADMEREMVCGLALSLETFSSVPGKAEISLPRLDINNLTKDAVFELLRGYDNLTLMGNPVRTEIKSCRFIRERCTFVRWDGKVSPCMGLLHDHTTYLNGNERKIEAYIVGDAASGDLFESGTRRNTGSSGRRSTPSIFRRATPAAAATISRPTGKTASAVHFRPAAAACGPKESSNALKWGTQYQFPNFKKLPWIFRSKINSEIGIVSPK